MWRRRPRVPPAGRAAEPTLAISHLFAIFDEPRFQGVEQRNRVGRFVKLEIGTAVLFRGKRSGHFLSDDASLALQSVRTAGSELPVSESRR